MSDQTVRLVFLGDAAQGLKATDTITASTKRLSVAQKEQAAGARTVTAENAKASQGFRTLESDIGKTSRGALAGSGAFRGLGRSVAFASAGFLGGYGLLAVLGSSINVMKEAGVNASATTQRLKSTGDVAGVTAKQIDVLAAAVSRKTAFDSESVHAAENVLLTFTQVRNEVGKGNDIYTRAVKLTADLARSLQEDVSPAAQQLGRALNDPIRGLTTLTRAGVQFTQGQRDQIKALTESGQILEAQNIILDAVSQKVGGLGAAYGDTAAGKIDKFRNEIRLLEQDLGTALLPEIVKLTDAADKWVTHLEQDKDAQKRFRDDIDGIASALGEAAHILHTVTDAVGGTKHAVELLLGLKIASWAEGMLGGITKLIGTSGTGAAGAEGAAAGTGLAGATAEATGLRAALTKLSALPMIVIGVEVLIHRKQVGDAIGNLFGGGKIGSVISKEEQLALGFASGQDFADLFGAIFGGGGGKGSTGATGGGIAPFPGSTIPTGKGGGQGTTAGRQKLIDLALSMIGTPYAWGGAGPGGFDCSGLVMWALSQEGVNIPHNSVAQFNSVLGKPVSKANLQPGDVVYGPGSDGTLKNPGHEGLYIGNGKVVEAPQTGMNVRTVSLADWIKYAGGFSGARSFLPGGSGSRTVPQGGGPSALQNLQLALAQAGTTGGTGDDAKALQGLIAYYKKQLANPSLPITSRINLLNTEGGYISQLDSITKTKKPTGLAGAAALVNIHHTLDAVSKLVDTAGLDKKFDPELDKINKELSSKFVTSATLAKIRNQLSDITKASNAEIAKAKAAVTANKQAFAAAWADLATAAFDAFDAETASHISPARALLNQLTAAHDQAALQQALTDAQKQLSDAQSGVGSDNSSSTLSQIQGLVGQAALANAIDRAQSQVLGISPQSIGSDTLISQLQQLLVTQNVPDADAVAAAQQAVDEAQYQIRVADLGKQADAEDSAYADARDQLRSALATNLDAWNSYYQTIGAKASAAASDFATVWASVLGTIPVQYGGTNTAGGGGATPGVKTLSPGFNIPSSVIGAGFGGAFADGGSGVAVRPTLFLAGEAGAEPYAFGRAAIQQAAGQMGGGIAHVHLSLGDGLDKLVEASVIRATPGVSLTIGRAADRRRREGRHR